MASFKILFKGSSAHDLRKIDKQYIPRIINAVEDLAGEPFPSQSRKLRDSESNYRLRVGDYRVIYQVDSKEKIISVYHIRHRREVYRGL
ncbi:MAG: type II toxin-antitoxin system RelE/ParE family toxin [bacterium]